MSYLQGPTVPSFSKAVISFWFMVPQASLNLAKAESDANDPAVADRLSGLVPLVVFGKEGTGATSSTSSGEGGAGECTVTWIQCIQRATWTTAPSPVPPFFIIVPEDLWVECITTSWQRHYELPTKITYSEVPPKPTDPSYIAVTGDGSLAIHLESTIKATASLGEGLTSYTPPRINQCGTDVTCYTWSLNYQCIGMDGESLLPPAVPPDDPTGGEETYGPIPGDRGTGAIHWSGGNISADKWHHVLIYFDLTGGTASSNGIYSTTSKLYVAIDDVNIMTGDGQFANTNNVVTFNSATSPGQDYSIGSMSIPAAALGIPSVAPYANKIKKVRMAEFLMWANPDGSFDTANEEFRRHFITAPNKNGKQTPVNQSPLSIPIAKTAAGDPVTWEPGADSSARISSPDPSAWPTTIKNLGTADIDFTKCQFNWMMGRNLGTLRTGKFIRTGRVTAQFPDPSIGG